MSPTVPYPLIPSIRDASRQLVRELGFMQNTLAGTDFSPTAVHALIEIGEGHVSTATDLRLILNLEKSTVSRLLRKLVEADQVLEKPNDRDAREKTLSLTPTGLVTLAEINDFAQAQVMNALGTAPPGSDERILDGLQIYAAALKASRTGLSLAQSVNVSPRPPTVVNIIRGYRPGILARVVDMHMRYSAPLVRFGQAFESSLATGLEDFTSRLDNPVNEIWAAIDGNQIIGTVCIDGQDLGEQKAHLRAFIVDERFRGAGAGGRLLREAMGFVDEQAFEETHLWTFRGLDAARRLYEYVGFVMTEEAPSNRWGEEVVAQFFVRKRPVSTA